MDFWAVYRLPIPYRKWLIRRWNKGVDEEKRGDNSHDDVSRPLSADAKKKLQAQAEQYQNRRSITGMMRPTRNA